MKWKHFLFSDCSGFCRYLGQKAEKFIYVEEAKFGSENSLQWNLRNEIGFDVR